MIGPNVSELCLNDYIGMKTFTRFSDYADNIFYFMYLSSSDQQQKNTINMVNDQEENMENNPPVFCHFTKIIINKKDTSTKILV